MPTQSGQASAWTTSQTTTSTPPQPGQGRPSSTWTASSARSLWTSDVWAWVREPFLWSFAQIALKAGEGRQSARSYLSFPRNFRHAALKSSLTEPGGG